MNRRKAIASATLLLALVLGFASGVWFASGPHPRLDANEHGGRGAAGSYSDHAPLPAAQVQASVWTCSMHPQIQLPKPGKCPICGMDLIPLAEEGGDDVDPSMFRMSEAARKLARISTATVERRSVTREIAMVGKVAYDETRVETISARFPGRLDRLFVDYTGVPVKAGDHLASIYSPELLTAQQELLQALRAAREVQGNVQFLRQTTQATIEASREKLRLWGLNPDQIRQIERSGKVSDHLTLYAHQSGIVVQKHQNEGDYVQEGSKIYTIADLTRLWVNLDAYESDLSWVHYGQEVHFETEAYPGETFEGRISFIHPVLDERTRTVKVRVNVENPRGRLKPGMFVRGRVLAELRGEGKVYDRDLAGKWISPMHPEVVEDGPGKCRVCEMPLVPAENLGFVGRIDTGDLPLVIPVSAPLLTGKRALVYVEVEGSERPTYQGRVVTLGPRAGEFYIVRDGLEVGEQVVVEGNFKIDSAVQIKAGPSMMTLPSEGPRGGESLRGTPFLAALEPVTSRLSRVAAAIADEDSDTASEGFEGVLEQVSSLPVEGLEGGARSLAESLASRLREAASLGLEAWELPEQRRALLRVGFALEEAGLPSPSVEPAQRDILEEVKGLALSLSEHLAGDDDASALASLRVSKTPQAVRPTAEETGSFSLVRWQLFLVLQELRRSTTLGEIREGHAIFSDLIVLLSRRFPSLKGDAKILACPMAFSGRGARWIQAPGEVANPYFGAAMLRCGEPYRPTAGGR